MRLTSRCGPRGPRRRTDNENYLEAVRAGERRRSVSFAVTVVAHFCAFAVAMCAAVAHAGPIVLECPVTIEVSSRVTNVPKGWIVVPGATQRAFDNIAIFDGHPKERASLVPDRDLEESGNGQTGISEWSFPSGSKNMWLGCSYRGTPSELALRLPDGIRKCSVQARKEAWGWEHERKVVCGKAA